MFRFVSAALAATLYLLPASGEAAAPPSCPPDASAAIAQSITPEKPLMAQISHETGTATVRVDLSATGALIGAHIARSSGSVFLDNGALSAVKALVFAPGSQSCSHVGGSYTVEVAYPD
jgi:TonB family protein